LGWAGTITHQQDVELIREPLQRILAAYPQTRLVIGGDPQVYALFADIPEAQRIFYPFVSAAEYPRLLAEFDILLAPLRLNAFNQAKSDLKLLEAGIRRIPWVASPTAPYRAWANGGLLASTTADWERALAQLVENATVRTQLGAQGHEQALTREAQVLAPRWAEVFADLAQNVAGERRAQETLAWLIAADDLALAVQSQPERMDAHLLALVRSQEETARAHGEVQDAEALAQLAEFIAVQGGAGDDTSAAQERAVATFQWLLESDDIAADLAGAADRLDSALLALVQANARAARQQGDLELAAGLDDLAAVIGETLAEML
jgi:hypothetical protein